MVKSHIHPALKSIRYSIDGIRKAFEQEPNFRIHTIITVFVAIVGILLQLSASEWIDIILVISLVLILELLNTSIEELTDLASPEFHPKAKIAKDVAAAAVLLASISAVLVGLIVFLPKILKLFY